MSEPQSSASSNTIDPRLCTNPASLPFCSSPVKTPTPTPTPSTKASSTLSTILTNSIPVTTSAIKVLTSTSIQAPATFSKIPPVKVPPTTSAQVIPTTSIKVLPTTSVKIPPTTSIKAPDTTSVKIPTTTSIKIPTTTSVKIPTTTQYITTSTTTTSTKRSTVTSSQTTMILKSIKPSNSAPNVGAGSPSDGLQAESVPTPVKNQGQDDPVPTGNPGKPGSPDDQGSPGPPGNPGNPGTQSTPSPIFSSITPSPAATSSPSKIPPPPASSPDPPVSSKPPVASNPPVSSQPPVPSDDPSTDPAKPPPSTSSSALPSSSSSADTETQTQKAAPTANKDSSKTTSSADFEAAAVTSSSAAAPTVASSEAVESTSTSDEPQPSTTSALVASAGSADGAQDTDQPSKVPSASLTGLSSALPAAITPTLSEILNPSNTMINSLGNNNPSTLVLASGTKPIPTGSTLSGPAGQPIAPPGTAPGAPGGTQPAGGQETGNPDLKLQNADKSSSSPPTGVIVGTAFGGFAAVAVLIIFIWLYRRRSQRRMQGNEPLTPLNGPAGGMTQGDGGAWGQSDRGMEEVQPNPRRLTLMPPASSSSNNPFSDANAVDKQPVRGILKAPVFEPFDFSLETAAVGVASTTDVAVPPVPPRSRARTAGHRSSQSFSTPTPPSRPLSSRHGSSLSLGQFTEKRDKFRSDPFDLEIDTSMIPNSLTPQITQNPRASSIYSSQVPNRSSRYTSGITISTLSDSDSPITGPAPTWDSPTLGNAELSKNGKKWPDNAFGVGQAL